MYGLFTCPICRSARSGPQGLCAQCTKSLFTPQTEMFELSLGPYSGPLERAVKAYKFAGTRRLAGVFGGALADALRASSWPLDVVCAVPLHSLRYMQRGFNQSALVARAAAKGVGLPYRPLLKRVRSTRQQARLGGTARQGNVAGAFRATPLSGERVLVVDDVMTSGATVTECALALFAAGAGRVYVATVARAQHGQQVAGGP